MTVTHNRERTARHEAGHAAAMIMAGRLPKRVTADRPATGISGEMEMNWGDGVDPAGARALAVAILLGPLSEPEPSPAWPPEWPLDPDAPGDAGQLAACLTVLKMDDEANWVALVREARMLGETAEFQRLVWLIGRGLELKDELTADDLRRLLGEKTLTKYGIEQE